MADGARYHAAGLDEVPEHDEWLTEAESARIEGFAYAKRRLETRLSRWTAKRTVALALGLPSASADELRAVTIRNAPDGAPEAFVDGAPAPVSISMTDRADWSVCIVDDPPAGVGCDLELVEPRSDAFVRDWFTVSEQRYVADRSAEHDLVVNVIWSAKESALKVLRTGLRRDTRSVEVHLEPGGGDDWAGLEVRAEEGDRFLGWWRRFDQFVLTCASRAGRPPPLSLVDPPPLSAAVPTHRWMSAPRRGDGGGGSARR